MNIAVVTGFDKLTVPNAKGGTEVWTANFVLEHARRGHSIDLYASAGSITGKEIQLVPLVGKALPEYLSESYLQVSPEEFLRRKERFLATGYARALSMIKGTEEAYDLVVDSVSYPSFSWNVGMLSTPVLSIGHFPVDMTFEFYTQEFGWPKNATPVFPSRFQKQEAEKVLGKKAEMIPHGIDLVHFRFGTGGESMLWMSRIHTRTDKGIADALQVAQMIEKPLRVSALIEPLPQQRAHFEQNIRPLISSFVTFEEQASGVPDDKSELYGTAKVFLFPTKWEEPFGLVMIEAMACGTPVVAYARGAIPEIVQDGVTGFVVNPSETDIRGDFFVKKTGLEGLCEAVERMYALSSDEYAQMRRACRERVEKYYTVEKMVDQYEELYKKLI